MHDVSYTIFNTCDNSREMVSANKNGPAFNAGFLSLATNNNPYAAVVFAISDEDLMPWMDDPGYEDPVLGSYF